MSHSLVPAAQYVRMSTEHQQYSLENQSASNQQYAALNGFSIVQTYSDAAKSGVVLRKRTGLQNLLSDVLSGTAAYKAILVFDVSRWGRFQDADEAAHYEFLCKSTGIPVHYCAEVFANDTTLPNLLMKALKRTMAGEYSRELGAKVLAGQRRLALLGFRQGGVPGYGLRRTLVSADGQRKQELASGERKSIATDRVILVPGPASEVQCVRDIYKMLIEGGLTVYAIARELNRRGTKYLADSDWSYGAVFNILAHPKYAGCHVFGRTSQKLSTPVVRLPSSEWTITRGAYSPIVDERTFLAAQKTLRDRTINKSDQELLDGLRSLLTHQGRLSLMLIKNAVSLPSPTVYRLRFGSLRRAYELIGYGRAADFGPIDQRRRTQALRDELMSRLQSFFPGQVSIVRPGGRWRLRLRLRNRLTISVLVSRAVRTWRNAVRWQIDPVLHEKRLVTLLARLDRDNRQFQDYHVLPNVNRQHRFTVKLKDEWLKRGERLTELQHLFDVIERVGNRAVRGH